METIEYTAVMETPEGGIVMMELEGEKYNIRGTKVAIHHEVVEDKWGNYDYWSITDLETGMKLSDGLAREEAINEAVKRLIRHDVNICFQRAKAMLREKGVVLPVNRVAA